MGWAEVVLDCDLRIATPNPLRCAGRKARHHPRRRGDSAAAEDRRARLGDGDDADGRADRCRTGALCRPSHAPRRQGRAHSGSAAHGRALGRVPPFVPRTMKAMVHSGMEAAPRSPAGGRQRAMSTVSRCGRAKRRRRGRPACRRRRSPQATCRARRPAAPPRPSMAFPATARWHRLCRFAIRRGRGRPRGRRGRRRTAPAGRRRPRRPDRGAAGRDVCRWPDADTGLSAWALELDVQGHGPVGDRRTIPPKPTTAHPGGFRLPASPPVGSPDQAQLLCGSELAARARQRIAQGDRTMFSVLSVSIKRTGTIKSPPSGTKLLPTVHTT